MRQFLLDNSSFSAPCRREHDPCCEADLQIILIQTQQIGAVLQSLSGLIL